MCLEYFINLQVVIVLLLLDILGLNDELGPFPIILLLDVIQGFACLFESLQLLLHIFDRDGSF